MRIRYLLVYLLIAAGLLSSCNTTEPPVDTGYNYFPLDTGRYYIYDVDSIWHDCNGSIDTSYYQIKEYYESIVLDASNNPVIRIERYYRANSTQPWLSVLSDSSMTPDVWYANRTTTRLEKVEENLRYVKMTYPIDESYTWNGNAYNILAAQDYFYGNKDISFFNGFTTFDSTITVYQKNDTTLIDYYLYTETYARNIGMVHKLKYNIESAIVNDSNDPIPPALSCWQDIPPPLFWYQVYILNRVKLGWLVTYKLIEWGYE